MLGLVAMLALVGAMVFASPAAAAPPPNDDFADAQVIGPGLPVSVNGTNADATFEAGEPQHVPPNNARRSVWYEWTPSAAVEVRLGVCGSSHVIGIYTGDSLGSLAAVPGSSFSCRRTFAAAAGTTYRIAIDDLGFEGESFTLILRELSPPANDDFGDAQTLAAVLPVSVSGTNLDAGTEAGEPRLSTRAATVWFQWTPTSNVRAKLEDSPQLSRDTTAAPGSKRAQA